MSNLTPANFVLRCYGHQISSGKYYGVCLELNLAAEAESVDQLKKEMGSMITSYIKTVLDTEDHESIPNLIQRPAPALDHFKYHLFRFLLSIRKFQRNFIFKEFIPFKLAHNA